MSFVMSLSEKQKLTQLLLETRSFQYSPESPFKLVSGATSPYYFDLKLLSGDPEGINLIAHMLYDSIRKMPGVRSVGGLATGSIAIATAISQLSWIEHQKTSSPPLTSFFVRKEEKKHGTGKRIEGIARSPIVIIDDVITSGLSAMSAVKAVKKAGFECKCLMSIIFRGTEEQRHTIESEIKLESIFQQDQLVKDLKELM